MKTLVIKSSSCQTGGGGLYIVYDCICMYVCVFVHIYTHAGVYIGS